MRPARGGAPGEKNGRPQRRRTAAIPQHPPRPRQPHPGAHRAGAANDADLRESTLMNMDLTPAADEKIAGLKTLSMVIYALYAVSLFIGVSAIVAIVLNYIKREDAQGTWLESHFTWQIRTFWWGLLWLGGGGITRHILMSWR